MARKTKRDPNQRQLFMTADEVVKHVYPGDVAIGDDTMPGFDLGWNADDHAAMWSVKLSEAHSSGLVDSIAKHGAKNPISLSYDDDHDLSDKAQVLSDGHHRVAAAIHLQGKGKTVFLPVKYED